MMRTRLVTLLCMGVLLIAAPIAAVASPPTEVSGPFVVTDLVPTGAREAGNTCHFTVTATFDLDGPIDGEFVADFRFVQQGPCSPGPAAKTFQSTGTFTGSVLDQSDTADILFVGTTDAQGNAQGRLVFRHGADGLANLHGRLVLAGIEGVSGTYTGQVHFDP